MINQSATRRLLILSFSPVDFTRDNPTVSLSVHHLSSSRGDTQLLYFVALGS